MGGIRERRTEFGERMQAADFWYEGIDSSGDNSGKIMVTFILLHVIATAAVLIAFYQCTGGRNDGNGSL
jgi:hypothetical protein